MLDAPIDTPKADFAERAGKQHLKRIRAELSDEAIAPGTLVAINVVDGEYVIAQTDLEVVDAFRSRFGKNAIGWIAELPE